MGNKIDNITRESWILGAFPEWGTWLNEEIEEEIVEKGTFSMWWIGCTGIWMKTENNTNISIDLWFGNGKRTKKVKEMDKFHQMRNMTGGRMTQPNLRAAPVVFDPFAVKDVDAVLSTHYHNDHIDPFYAAAVIKNVQKEVPFIGPKKCVEKWISYGVPKERCKEVKPGDVIKIKDIEIVVLDSFGVGELPDADKYGDVGANTLGHIYELAKPKLTNMKKLGLYNIDGLTIPEKEENPIGNYGKAQEKCAGKNSPVGHWEISGFVKEKPFKTYPNGFPDKKIGRAHV